eukprot:s2880_g1.t1
MSGHYGARPSQSGESPGSELAARMLSQKRPRPSASTPMSLRRQAETSGSKPHAGHDPLPDVNVRVRFITGHSAGAGGLQQLPRALTYGPPAALAPVPLHETALVPLKPVWGPRCMPGNAPALPMLEPPAPKVVKATWIEVADTADILKEGWPAMAPAVVYDAAAKDISLK